LLSDAATSTSGTLRSLPKPVLTAPGESRRTEPLTAARANNVSPFAADSARKGNPKAEISGEVALSGADTLVREHRNVVIMGSAAPAVEVLSPEPIVSEPNVSEPDVPEPDAPPRARAITAETNCNPLRDAILSALSNQQMLVSLLETGEWSMHGNTLTAKAAASSTMIEMSFTADARRVASAAASGAAGRPIKVTVEPGGTAQAAPPARKPSSNGSARSRAEQDPIVQRMQEKFGAEIRTVIDYREKG
jgi:DNA polymerase-3 subunit gamma/tau